MLDSLSQYNGPPQERRGLTIFRRIFGDLVESGVNKEEEKERLRIMSGRIDDFARSVRSRFPIINEQRGVMQALFLMLELHTGQDDRKEGGPSISHPFGVANDILRGYGIPDSRLVNIGLLHDCVENHAKKLSAKREERLGRKLGDDFRKNALDELRYLFGERVMKAVGGLTNPDFEPEVERLKRGSVAPPGDIKNYLYASNVRHKIKDPDVFVVKLADIGQNCTRPQAVAKYRPVIQKVFKPALNGMGRSHPFFGYREKMLAQIERISNL